MRITYLLNGGSPVVKTLTVAAASRATVAVHDAALGVGRNGGVGWEVSAIVESTNGAGIVVERPTYFTYVPSPDAARVAGGRVVTPSPVAVSGGGEAGQIGGGHNAWARRRRTGRGTSPRASPGRASTSTCRS